VLAAAAAVEEKVTEAARKSSEGAVVEVGCGARRESRAGYMVNLAPG
jgi:hypothetical protein